MIWRYSIILNIISFENNLKFLRFIFFIIIYDDFNWFFIYSNDLFQDLNCNRNRMFFKKLYKYSWYKIIDHNDDIYIIMIYLNKIINKIDFLEFKCFLDIIKMNYCNIHRIWNILVKLIENIWIQHLFFFLSEVWSHVISLLNYVQNHSLFIMIKIFIYCFNCNDKIIQRDNYRSFEFCII